MHPRSLFAKAMATILCLLFILSCTLSIRAQPQCTGSFTITDSIVQTPFPQRGRLTQNGVNSSCATQKAFPGVADTNPRYFKVYNFVNNNDATACITVTLNVGSCTGSNGLFSAAYTAYNPQDISLNYLADIRGIPSSSRSYSFNVAAGADFQVVVHHFNSNQSCGPYTLTVSGFGCLPPSEMLISEVRFGVESLRQNDHQDEYIELYNNTDAPLTVSTTDNSEGWALVADDGVIRFIVPNGTQIPARGRFLGVNSAGYSLADYPAGSNSTATGDATYTRDIVTNRSGIALFRTANPANFTRANRLDAIGFMNAQSLYRENGLMLQPISTDGTIYSHVRRMNSGLPQDTGDNAMDFVLLSPVDRNRLGWAGPENLSSPVQRNSTIKASLIDQGVSVAAPPNRVRSATAVRNGQFGTLTLRRKFRNNTGANVSRLRFRVVDITTRGNIETGEAALRVLDSAPEVVSVSGGEGMPPATITVQGLTREQSVESYGGALNSSLSCCATPEGAPAGTRTVSLAQPFAPGDTIHLQFRLGVEQNGNFRFFINVEAETDTPAINQLRQIKSSRTRKSAR